MRCEHGRAASGRFGGWRMAGARARVLHRRRFGGQFCVIRTCTGGNCGSIPIGLQMYSSSKSEDEVCRDDIRCLCSNDGHATVVSGHGGDFQIESHQSHGDFQTESHQNPVYRKRGESITAAQCQSASLHSIYAVEDWLSLWCHRDLGRGGTREAKTIA